jgi:hypothetical protein
MSPENLRAGDESDKDRDSQSGGCPPSVETQASSARNLNRLPGGLVSLNGSHQPRVNTLTWPVVRWLLGKRMLVGIYLGTVLHYHAYVVLSHVVPYLPK